MNVILIILDDLGWNDVGFHNKQVMTPNIDKLHKEGCEINRNYTFTVCGPTRSMIQTGIYAYKCGMQRLFDPWVDYGLDENLKIIPQYLKELNYDTYAIGKWHLGHCRDKFLPHKRGYDYHYGHLTGCVDQMSHKHCNLFEESIKHDFSENGKAIYPKGYSCSLLTDKVIEIIEKAKNNFFVYLAYLDPHVPLNCPQEFKSYYKLAEPRKSYLGMVSHVDFQIGRIINKLKEKNIYEDTTIWLMSDNGGWTLDFAGADNYPLKNGKCFFYEGGIRTCSILKNKKINQKKFDGFTHSVDILPTILDFCDYEKKIELDGISLVKDLTENTQTKRNITLCFYDAEIWCFLIDELKFIKTKDNFECFDLLNDPLEKNNIIKEKYPFFKKNIDNQINYCLTKRIYEKFEKGTKKEILQKCSEIKFWGQQQKNQISILSNEEEYNKLMVNSKMNFLEASGYDRFYK
jgi:arylsulfatase A-like enzyme